MTLRRLLATLAVGTALSCGDGAPEEPEVRSAREALSAGDLVVNEVHPNPDSTGADPNGDGASNETQDEFIEIVNRSGRAVDLNGLTIADSAAVKFTFPSAILPPGEAAVVFGGGPVAAYRGEFGNARSLGLVFSAMGSGTSGLGLNNSGAESAAIQEGGVDIDRLTFSGTSDGLSYNRAPEVEPSGTIVLHNAASGSRSFSPGTRTNGEPFTRFVAAVDPLGGPNEGGTPVRIRGAGFSGQVASVVFRRGAASAVAASVTKISTLELSAVTPPFSAGAVDVEVVDAYGTIVGLGKFTYGMQVPVDAGIPPDAGDELPEFDAGDEPIEYPIEDPFDDPDPLPQARDGGTGAQALPAAPSGVCGCGASGSSMALPLFAAALAVLTRRRGRT